MGQRERLEKEVAMAKDRIDNAPSDTPPEVREMWEKDYVNLSFDLNNYTDDVYDNNEE